ncbi:WavE lipopolysaccharide synthesis family protein [Xanthomonas prunicola]|uniref:WavE lipopolysaccharide synthesis family protein n=1 Tax=Xanthomonas prunicola TaxID=2053930 RepID=A0A9Q9J409_9XANT|nr:WavE lipopolysaccharide synthesis family protein [Xanthomonas prunicola]USJ00564.1 WavE lipopolysaccharide synthesis family protein [Xanthomonas prunicola]UXA53129.1 WavE lipopolysaccharide synthesis family protein [Xanthomonas prunicola]UXA59584.1 WavE lipopolysaccharide synthesis family protein [Xanthomonas prunicola]UXA65596.1 WavE lipopolysaccharide synthesis family protein [Xanthomonas prunicola]UXA69172.1 WavE lipopolysaccharide synthesis family protein [Xanthomonas prunicola]
MALAIGSIERATIKYPGLNPRNTKLIGWGAGQFFRDFYPAIAQQLNLQYTICPRPENQGMTVHGLPVRSPSALEDESVDDVLIVIFSNHAAEVMNQIARAHGRFRTVRAVEYDQGSIALLQELQDFSRLLPELQLSRQLTKADTGIFVQGLAFDFTPLVLAWNRLRFPWAYQCMVTWDHQPSALLDRCRPWLDKLILVPQPDNLGLHYRNAVLRSARLGVEHLAEQGIKFAVRCRSDNVLNGSIHDAINTYFRGKRNQGKIAISLGGGFRNIPFLFTEKAMLGRTQDMLALWSMPEDPRSANYADDELSPMNELAPNRHFQQISQYAFESSLWKDYARRLGFPAKTLVDSYRFAQSRLLALEPHMSWTSLKLVSLFNVARDNSYGFSLDLWNRLFTDSDAVLEAAEAVSRLELNSTDFWQGRVG